MRSCHHAHVEWVTATLGAKPMIVVPGSLKRFFQRSHEVPGSTELLSVVKKDRGGLRRGRGGGGHTLWELFVFWRLGLGSPRTSESLIYPFLRSCNAFTTGNPFWGTKLLGFSIGRGLGGSLKGL